jgi:ligand-binding SRPBCC domain-containing protein
MEFSCMLHFQKTSWIEAPVAQVWAFHARSVHLLVAPWQPVQLIRQPTGIEIGTLTEYRLWLGLLSVSWVSVVTAVDPHCQFTEQQQTGPMPLWEHSHRFQAQGDATLLTDEIHYELPGGDLAAQSLGWWVTARLSDMFAYRHQITSQSCCPSYRRVPLALG